MICSALVGGIVLAKLEPEFGDQLQTLWIQHAIEQRLLDVSEVAQILVEAAGNQADPVAIAKTRLAGNSDKLAKLNALIAQWSSQVASRSRQTLDESDQEQTQGAGRSSRRRKSGDSGTRRSRSATSQGSSANRQAAESASRANSPGGARPGRNSIEHASPGTRYRITAEVGRGGCGVVHKARDLQLERDVVLKTILDDYVSNDEVVQRFLNEARITGQLDHPGIVPVHEIGTDADGSPFFAMKEVRGETLAAKIAELESMPDGSDKILRTRKILDRFLSVCQTVAFAHQANVIHRDIKPANIMVGEFGETILLDWGLARRVGNRTSQIEAEQDATRPTGLSRSRRPSTSKSTPSDPPGSRNRSGFPSAIGQDSDMTRQGTVLGTAAYMSPEQASGKNDLVNQTSDVFSLGAMLYEILSGQSPFRSDTLQDTISRVAQCKYRPLRELNSKVPRPLAAICAHAMQRSREKRYPTAQELAEDVQNYLSGGRVSVYDEKPWERFDRTANNHRGLFRAVFCCSILVASGALFAAGRIGSANHKERLASRAAIAARDRAESALVQERVAHKAAQTQLAASRKAADSWLLDLSGDLQFYPGMESIRSKLIRDGIEHYRGLQTTAWDQWQIAETRVAEEKQNGASPNRRERVQLWSQWASCSLRLADLLHLMGQGTEATQHLKAVLESAQKNSLESDPASDEAYEMLVHQSNAAIGLALVGSEADGLPAWMSKLKSAVSARPGYVDARNSLVRACLVSARALTEPDPEAALGFLNQALANVDILFHQDASNRHQTLRGTVLEDRARLLLKIMRYADAEQACRDLIRFRNDNMSETPGRPDQIESRSIGFSMLGASLLGQADTVQALDAFSKASEDLESAWDLLYGESFYRENRGILAQNQSQALWAQGKLQESEDKLRAAIAEIRWLLQSDGVSPARIRRIAECYHTLVKLLFMKQSGESQHAEVLVEIQEVLQNARVLVDHLESQEQAPPELACNQLLLESQAALTNPDGSRLPSQLDEFVASIHAQPNLNPNSKHWFIGVSDWLRLQTTEEPNAADVRQVVASLTQAAENTNTHLATLAHELRMHLLCFESDAVAEANSPAVLRIAFQWADSHPNSATGLHWYAIALLQNGQIAESDAVIQKAISARGGQASPEDELVGAILAVRLGAPSAETRVGQASRRLDESSYVRAHAPHLRQLLSQTSSKQREP